MVLEDSVNDGMGHPLCVVMSNHDGAFIENWFEKPIILHELLLPCLRDCRINETPHCRDNEDVLERAFSTKLAEHIEVSPGDPSHSGVGDPVHVYDTAELHPRFISGIM